MYDCDTNKKYFLKDLSQINAIFMSHLKKAFYFVWDILMRQFIWIET